MRWKVHGRQTMYESDWVNVYLDDVELPDGTHIDHHVLHMPRASAGAVVTDDEGQILLIWRHRFIPDSWGWEVPAGWVDDGETSESAAKREIEEETGWTVEHIEPLVRYFPLAGISDQNYRAFWASKPRELASVEGSDETSKVQWFSPRAVVDLARKGQISDGPSLLILSYFLGVFQPGD